MARRNYEQKTVSAEDRAFVRGLVIHEDEAVLAFDKPAGLPVQTRNPDDRTLDSLMAAFAKSNGKRPRLVHRLDAQTSGVIIAGKTQPAAAALSAAFAGREVRKRYLALVSGEAFKEKEGIVEIALSRYRPKPELELMRAARPGDAQAQAALTAYRVVASAGTMHLLEAQPETGRMHQIRAHLSLLGRPIVGDAYYGGLAMVKGEVTPRLMLHAQRILAPHPSGGRFGVYADAPKDFRAMLALAGIDLASATATS